MNQQVIIQHKPLSVRPRIAAEMIGVSTSLINELLDSGAITFSQPGGPNTAKLVLVSSIESWLQEGVVKVA